MNRFILSILAVSFPLMNNPSTEVLSAFSLDAYYRIILLLCIFCLTGKTVFSQSYSSKDNYIGAWETPASWNPEWTLPQTTNIAGMDIIINGYITVNGSLSFSGSPANLIINDTLVIKGDLSLGTYNNLTINGNGILIIRGNLILDNNFNIITNNYIVITGYIWKTGSNNIGSFVSNSNPTKVFVGAYVYPTAITNKPNFPALNCTAPTTTPYSHSNCSYGDMTDLLIDPIYPFYQSTCIMVIPTISAVGPITFCTGGNVTLTSSAEANYLWSTGATTQSINVTTAESYTVQVTNANGCPSAASAPTVVTINALPVTPTITAGGPATFCDGGSVNLTSSEETSYFWSNGATTPNINVTTAGNYTVQVTNASGCQSAVSVATIVTVNALPATPTITAGGPTTFCDGGSVTLISSAGSTYLWSTGATAANINITTAGSYAVKVKNVNGCQSSASAVTIVNVNALPLVNIISSSSSMCTNDFRALTASPAGGTFIITDGPGTITGNVLSATGTGNINLEYNYTNVCTNKAIQSIIVNENPVADAGPDTLLKFVFETEMKAKFSSFEKGEWSLISGSGIISDIYSPTTWVTELSGGENIFLWKVRNGNCQSGAEVIISVYDPFIPSVITPNGDRKNDYFKISEIIGQVELIIFNQWGNEEYTNRNYSNDWDGRNNKGVELPNDTYFYILKFEDIKIKKGSVLIKR
jgi:gliding motility-associated-like protein